MSTITEKLKWLIEADASSAIKGFTATGVAAESSLKKAESSSQKLGGTLTKVGAGSLAVAGIVGGALVKAAGSFEDLALKAGEMSDATGLSVDQASRWIEVSDDMGIGADTIESALGKMNKTLGATPAKFEELGIKIATTKSGAEDVNGTFLNTIDRLNQIEDPAARAAAAAGIFGKGWQGAAELLKLSTDDIRTQLQAVSDQKVINDEELQKAKDYRADLDDLKDSAENLMLAIGQSAAPVIGALATLVGGAVDVFTKLDTATHGAAGGILAGGAAALGTVGAFSMIAGQAIKIKAHFTDASGSMTTFGEVAIAAAVGVGLVMISAADHARNMNARLAELNKTAMELSRVSDSDIMGLLNHTLMLGVVTGKDLDEVMASLAQTNLDGAKRALELGAANGLNEKQTIALRQAIIDEDAAQAQAVVTTDTYKSAVEDAATKQAEADETAKGYKGAVDALIDSVKKAEQAEKDNRDAIANGIQAQRDMNQARKDALGNIGDLEQSLRDLDTDYYNLQQQQLENIKTQDDHTLSQGEKDQSNRDLLTSEHNLAEKVAETAAKYAEENGAVEGTKRQTDLMRDSLELSKAKYPELATEIQKYIDKLLMIPTDVNTVIHHSPLINGRDTAATGGAHSGTTLVGEQGPELVDLPNGSFVHTAAETAAMAGSGGAGVNIGEVHVHVQSMPSPNELVTLLKKYEARNGTAWRA